MRHVTKRTLRRELEECQGALWDAILLGASLAERAASLAGTDPQEEMYAVTHSAWWARRATSRLQREGE